VFTLTIIDIDLTDSGQLIVLTQDSDTSDCF